PCCRGAVDLDDPRGGNGERVSTGAERHVDGQLLVAGRGCVDLPGVGNQVRLAGHEVDVEDAEPRRHTRTSGANGGADAVERGRDGEVNDREVDEPALDLGWRRDVRPADTVGKGVVLLPGDDGVRLDPGVDGVGQAPDDDIDGGGGVMGAGERGQGVLYRRDVRAHIRDLALLGDGLDVLTVVDVPSAGVAGGTVRHRHPRFPGSAP